MLALVLVAVSVGLSNLAASVAIGVSGVTARTRVEVAVVFGAFELVTPIVGLALGHRLSHTLGGSARWTGGGLLVAAGVYGLAGGLRAGHDAGRPTPGVTMGRGWLVATGAALSVDNLVVGFALGAHHVSVVAAALVIGVVSVALSLVGLEFGNRIGRRAGGRAEVVGAVALIAVGAAVAAGWL